MRSCLIFLLIPLRAEELVVSNKLEIDQMLILHFLKVKMNQFEAHLMVSSREVDSKVLRMAIQSEYFF